MSRVPQQFLPCVAALGVLGPAGDAPAETSEDRFDPSQMMGVEVCGDCHDSAVESWEQTAHATTFDDLHRQPLAEKIARLMGIDPIQIRRHESCVRCHYTQEEIHSVVQVTHSISCETCHGASADWVDVHNRGSLSRSFRISRSSDAGMLHPANPHALGSRCFDCHVIDDEKLVNIAGHPAMTEGFELYSWSQGEMKHNFLVDRPDRNTKRNTSEPQPIPQARKRQLYLAGKLMHLSASLRALAKSKDPPVDVDGNYIRLPNDHFTYAVQHARQVNRLQAEIRDLHDLAPNDCYRQTLAILEDLRLETGNSANIQNAAEKIGEFAETFCQEHTGREFEAIDPILEGLTMR